jgi:hypothetical protein
MSGSTSAPSGWVGGIVLGLVLATGLALVVVARRRQRASLRLDAAQAVAEAAVGMPFVPIRSGTPSPPLEGDENVPRWRRPSVAAARFGNGNTSAIRTATAASMLRGRPARVFAEPTDLLGERMVVRYGVPLLNRPEEEFGRVLEELASGDQVEILDHGDIWANVITPSGAAGWVPSATLGPTTARRDDEGEDPAVAVDPALSSHDAEPPSLEALLEEARRAREEAAREPEKPDVEAGPAKSDDRPPRPRRRPKTRSTTRQS